MDAGNLISCSSAFCKSSLNIWKFTVHILLKPGLENFEHYFASMWDECNCLVVWAFFGIAFLWDWNENWPFPVLWPLLSFPNLLTYWMQYFHTWNSSIGNPPPPLALFIVMLPKAHLTSHSRMSGRRWVIIPLWLSWSLRTSLVAQAVKRLSTMRETWVWSLGWEDSPGEGNGNPLQYYCQENPMDRGAW